MAAWKTFEKEVATFFGGLRRIRIMYHESIGDVLHPYFQIECKYGGQVPKYLSVDMPYELTVQRGNFYCRYRVVPSMFIAVKKKIIYSRRRFDWNPADTRKKATFLERTMEQAKKYDSSKRPLVCVKPKYRRGFVCIWEIT